VAERRDISNQYIEEQQMAKTHFRALGSSVVVGLGLAVLAWTLLTANAETMSLAQLRQSTHIHGIAVDPENPSQLYLATHHGLFLVSPNGQATRISENTYDYMGFTPHPTDPSVLYASGHPTGGGNLGFMVSTDGGKTWQQRAKGVNGPVDFHQMDVSKANPEVIYGVHGGLQVSRDGGHSWALVAALPGDLIDLAASAKEVDRLYAATKRGLLYSKDGGKSWQLAYLIRRPVSMVQTTSNGEVYAFMVGTGLIKAKEPGLVWDLLSQDWEDRYLLHLATDPTHPDKLYAVTQTGEVLASQDGGRSWMEFGNQ
jgi:hypothetical protein